VGVAPSTAPVVSTPTRLVQIKNLDQPPHARAKLVADPTRGRDRHGRRSFSYAMAPPRKRGRVPFSIVLTYRNSPRESADRKIMFGTEPLRERAPDAMDSTAPDIFADDGI
jgi:hypothetical protein